MFSSSPLNLILISLILYRKIASGIQESLPKLEELVLTNNALNSLGDLEPLAAVKTLRRLCLLGNDVAQIKHFRLFVIFKIPQLVLLDYQKVKDKEREEASRFFAGSEGQSLLQNAEKATATEKVNGGGGQVPEEKATENGGADGKDKIRAAIANANSLEEIRRLEALLQSGGMPGVT